MGLELYSLMIIHFPMLKSEKLWLLIDEGDSRKKVELRQNTAKSFTLRNVY
jgi:hypothetical protein